MKISAFSSANSEWFACSPTESASSHAFSCSISFLESQQKVIQQKADITLP